MAKNTSSTEMTTAAWTSVVLVAGIGTILEWFDFYIYTQLSSVLTKVFFPVENPTAQALAYWGVFAAAFVVRPLGALLFGHIGDTAGRNKTLTISIVCMAVPTFLIGCLPTYGTGNYFISPPMLAPISLAVLRMLQGLAMGGEFGSAVIYISELASPKRRGLFVTLLQSTVNIGMILATLLVMLLENTISPYDMLVWGWRIPFLMAFCTAMLGFVLRRGMPEPHAFLEAARAEKAALAANNMETAASAKDDTDYSAKDDSVKVGEEDSLRARFQITATPPHHSQPASIDMEEEEDGNYVQKSHSKVPIVRLLKNNWAGVLIQICYMAWVSGAFYIVVSWLAASLKKSGMPVIQAQGVLIVSLLFNAVGLIGMGHAFDRGMKAIHANVAIVVLGAGVGFGVFYGVGTSYAAAWCLVCFIQLIVGAAMAIVVLPCTRIYSPLERTTGFSFGYNCGYGVVGGLSPMIVTAIKASLSTGTQVYAPAFWLLALGAMSLVGSVLLRFYNPRLNKPFVGHIE